MTSKIHPPFTSVPLNYPNTMGGYVFEAIEAAFGAGMGRVVINGSGEPIAYVLPDPDQPIDPVASALDTITAKGDPKTYPHDAALAVLRDFLNQYLLARAASGLGYSRGSAWARACALTFGTLGDDAPRLRDEPEVYGPADTLIRALRGNLAVLDDLDQAKAKVGA